jgi:hypothetical protein
VDPLNDEDHWVGSGRLWNSCRFDDGMRVTTRTNYRCIGPDAAFPLDLAVEVEADIAARSCGSIWFRMVGNDGYRADVCQAEARLSRISGGAAVGGTGTGRAVAQGTQKLALVVRANTATISIGGRTVLKNPLTGVAGRGAVTFGATAQDLSGGSEAIVTFRHASIKAIR